MSKGTGAAKLTIIVDNKAAEGLLCEHGFAVWIEVAGRRLLFDTGQGAAIAGNADMLGIDLRTADALVLSHGHYDHTGGVPLLIARAPTAEIYAHPAATGPRYSLRDGVAKQIAMPAAALRLGAPRACAIVPGGDASGFGSGTAGRGEATLRPRGCRSRGSAAETGRSSDASAPDRPRAGGSPCRPDPHRGCDCRRAARARSSRRSGRCRSAGSSERRAAAPLRHGNGPAAAAGSVSRAPR